MDAFYLEPHQSNIAYVKRLGPANSEKRLSRIIEILGGLNYFHYQSENIDVDISWLISNRGNLVLMGGV
jgi:hypothetical protein